VLSSRERIQRSSTVSGLGAASTSLTFIRINRDAFQSLFARSRPWRTFSAE
jgi:hypothetical protein